MAPVGTVWSSRFGFLMACIGFAVGLGNIWRFPYITGENGGSAFVIVYLMCAVGIGVPILMAELMLGREGRLTPPAAMAAVAQQSERSRVWAGVGYLNLLTAFSILIAYTVVAGWVLYYLLTALVDGFAGTTAQSSQQHFDALLGNIPALITWTVAALGLAAAIIYAGVQKGIERAVTVMMPLLFFLLLGLAGYNLVSGGMEEAVRYLFSPDFSKLSPGMILAAVGQAFFSIGVAMAGMMMFGAYLPKDVSIAKSAFVIVLADTGVALLAGLVIFPMVFHNGLDPGGGTGLIFQTLPVAFAQMTGGAAVSVVFFLLLSVAAVTSVVGLCEPLAAWLSERFSWSRHRAVVLLVAITLAMSLVSVLSYNRWQDINLFGTPLGVAMDVLPNLLFLPLGGLLIALFVGYFVKPQISRAGLGIGAAPFSVWLGLIRYVVVPAVVIILVTGVLN